MECLAHLDSLSVQRTRLAIAWADGVVGVRGSSSDARRDVQYSGHANESRHQLSE